MKETVFAMSQMEIKGNVTYVPAMISLTLLEIQQFKI